MAFITEMTYTTYTVDLPNFEHVPYFEHHVNKQYLSLQLKIFIHQPTYIFMN